MGTNLKFVKVNSIDCIPKYLFEQAKPLDFDIDRLYSWAPVLLNNPMNIIGGFLDKEENIKGVMIVSYNPIPNKLHVHCLSIDKEYYNKGIMKEVKGILNKLKKNINFYRTICFFCNNNIIRF